MPIRVAVIDDHPPIVAALVAAIDATPDLCIVGTATTIEAALALLEPADRPIDVVVCDVQLAGQAEGLRLLDAVRAGRRPDGPRPAVVLLSGFDQPSMIRAAIERGAAGYVLKTQSMAQIVDAIRTVAAGGTAYTAIALRSIGNARRRPSERELQVIRLVSGGASNGEIARALGLSEKTVESHLRRLFDRYGVLSRTELAVLSLDEGWIATPEAARDR
jgi:DNA-binding NarL/FixJ family response regulator